MRFNPEISAAGGHRTSRRDRKKTGGGAPPFPSLVQSTLNGSREKLPKLFLLLDFKLFPPPGTWPSCLEASVDDDSLRRRLRRGGWAGDTSVNRSKQGSMFSLFSSRQDIRRAPRGQGGDGLWASDMEQRLLRFFTLLVVLATFERRDDGDGVLGIVDLAAMEISTLRGGRGLVTGPLVPSSTMSSEI